MAQELELTSIHQDVQRQGELAAQLIIDALAGKPVAESNLLPTKLILRGSTGRLSPTSP